jgi:hypothetical protein
LQRRLRDYATTLSLDQHFLKQDIAYPHRLGCFGDAHQQFLAQPVHTGGAPQIVDPEFA